MQDKKQRKRSLTAKGKTGKPDLQRLQRDPKAKKKVQEQAESKSENDYQFEESSGYQASIEQESSSVESSSFKEQSSFQVSHPMV